MFYEKFWHITIHQMLRKIEHLYRERTALQWRQGGQTFTVTYGKLMEDVWRLAARFQALGLKAQPLVIDGRNTYEQVVAFLAGAAMGAIVAPLSFDLPLENLRDLIARVQPAALVYDQEDVDLLYGDLAARADFQLLKRVVLDGCTMLEAAEEYGITVEACKKRIQRLRAHLKKKLSDL